MRILDLIEEHDQGGETDDLLRALSALKSSNDSVRGVVVYGFMPGCPYCIEYDSTWADACKDCPRDVKAFKLVMTAFPDNDDRIGSPPHMFPTVYTYSKASNGDILRKNHSSHRDSIREVMDALSRGGYTGVSSFEGEEDIVTPVDDSVSPDKPKTSTRKRKSKRKSKRKKQKGRGRRKSLKRPKRRRRKR